MPLKIGASMPLLTDATEWLNLNHSQDSLRNTVNRSCSVIHFWAKSCPACKENMPRLQVLRDRYMIRGLETIAVHMPRGKFDLDLDSVKAAVLQLGMTEPCAVDNDHKIGERFEVKAWPTYYLFDGAGLLKRHAAGGFGVMMIEAAVKDLFGE